MYVCMYIYMYVYVCMYIYIYVDGTVGMVQVSVSVFSVFHVFSVALAQTRCLVSDPL